MPRKIIKRKKARGLLYHKKRLILVFSLALFSLVALLFLPPKDKQNTDCANSLSCISNLTGNYTDSNSGEFEGRIVNGPPIAAKPYKVATNQVLGDATGDSKRIYVDLSKQRLYAFENNNLIHEFPVSTGKYGTTPTGDFRIWIKLRYTRMKGGSKELGTYYDLPNVPYTMYFYNEAIPKYRGYGIHGAYWHNNFGQPMSHGCINMREADVAKIYEWAHPPSTNSVTHATKESPGTLITIYGVAPKN